MTELKIIDKDNSKQKSKSRHKKIDKQFLPILITRELFVFPGYSLEIEFAREISVNTIKIIFENYDGNCLVVSQKSQEINEPSINDIHKYGIFAKLQPTNENINIHGTKKIIVNAIKRIKLNENITVKNKIFYGTFVNLNEEFSNLSESKALLNEIIHLIDEQMITKNLIPSDVMVATDLNSDKSISVICDGIAHYLPISSKIKQEILKQEKVKRRLEILIDELKRQKSSKDIEKIISKKIRSKIDETQKEYLLREKLKVIKEELGELSGKDTEIGEIRKKLQTEPYPENIKNKVLDELKKYEIIPQASAESNVIYSYIDWLVKLPWWQVEKESKDLDRVWKILERNHYGLKKLKERIIEYIAVKIQLSNTNKNDYGDIICLVGPPGVGKTSLAKSIAESINRKFFKISLGGVRDEAEIRGHRRTYIGSMPGKIIQTMRKAQVINPVILLDEIDKMSSDFRGDPSSAMLEVLDPEQNKSFSDHYLEEPYDLSKVLFIASANYVEDIPYPLLDRMEIITLSSYTELEKLQIVKFYLIKKVLEASGLSSNQLSFTKEAILYIINYYTKEAGVRQLERLLLKIARKAVLLILLNKNKSLSVTKEVVRDFLGYEIYNYTKREAKNIPGVVTGLAWTSFGGDILPIEVTSFEGKSNLVLTGQLGEVMKESASIALDYIKSKAKQFNIPSKFFDKRDIHIHVPEGAVSKDGPSAGVTLTSAIISMLKNEAVSKYIAMTGEITLTGKILPIGGLKEKLISAARSKITNVFIPKENVKNLVDVPQEVLKALKIVSVSHYSELYEYLFANKSIIDSVIDVSGIQDKDSIHSNLFVSR